VSWLQSSSLPLKHIPQRVNHSARKRVSLLEDEFLEIKIDNIKWETLYKTPSRLRQSLPLPCRFSILEVRWRLQRIWFIPQIARKNNIYEISGETDGARNSVENVVHILRRLIKKENRVEFIGARSSYDTGDLEHVDINSVYSTKRKVSQATASKRVLATPT